MKKHTKSALLVATSLFAIATALFVNHNLKHKYKPGEYIASEHAYYDGEVEDPAGFVKAESFVTPTDTYYSAQKARSHGTSMIGDIQSVWDSYTGKGTTIAIIDDGFDYTHPDYVRSDGTSAILSTSRYFYTSGTSVLHKDYSEEPDCIKEDWAYNSIKEVYEWNTHGTNTSTTAAAPLNGIGGVGIAPEADILALKTDMQFSSISHAIRYAVNQGVDVINMSLGAYAETFTDGTGKERIGYSYLATYLNDLCTWAYNQGVIVVAAAGNHATYHKSYPACNSYVIGVGALDSGAPTTLANFTNYVGTNQTGEVNVDILAPGYVYTAGQNGTENNPSHAYFETAGTSFSSPIVAAAACLWKEKYPEGTPAQFLSELQSTASDIGTYASKNIRSGVGPSNISQGRINISELLDIDSPYVATDQSNISLMTGETRQITLSSFNGDISYSSNNTDVATVSDSGLVRGKSSGSARITVIASKNTETAYAYVDVLVSSSIAPTSIYFDPATVTLDIGDTYNAEETIVTVPSNASRLFMYESGDENVFTVDDDGIITAVGAGTDDLYVIGENDTEAYLSVTVNPPSTPTSWDKATSISEGDYLIVCESQNVAFNGGLETLDVSGNKIAVTISNNQIAYNQATESAKVTIKSMTGGYSIKTASGKYIYGTSGSNALNSSNSEAANTITITSGDADIVSNTSHLRYNSSANQFRYYRSSSYTGQKAVQLYKATYGGTPVPTVSGVTVSPSALSLDVYNNKTGNLTATVNGTNNPSQSVTWSSNNESVATVSNGTVTAIGTGTATITATSTADTSYSGDCTVTVTDSTPVTLSSISINHAPNKTSYEVGEYFDPTGLVINRHYSNATTDTYAYSGHESEFSFDPDTETALTTDNTSVSISYGGKSIDQSIQVTTSGGGGGGTSTHTYTIGWGTATGAAGTYTNYTNTSGTVTDILSFACEQEKGTAIPSYHSADKELRLYYNSGGNGGSITITPATGITITGFVMKTNTNPTVKYFVNGGSATSITASNSTYTVSNIEATTSLKIQNGNTTNTQLKISYITITYTTIDTSDKIIGSLIPTYSGGDLYMGDSLDESKVSVTARYTLSSKYTDEVLTSSDYSISGFSSTTPGTKVVTVTYTGSAATQTTPLTATFDVLVKEDTVTSVTASCSKTFHPGETIQKNDISVSLTYSSGKNTSTTEFTFEEYQFLYQDAPSGGTTGTKKLSITYNSTSYDFNVSVSRVAYQAVSGTTDTLTRGTTGVSSGSNNYTSWSGKVGSSGSIYAGQSAGLNDSIQLRSSNNNSGIIMTASGGKVVKVSVTWQTSTSNGRTLNVYGKNSAYSSPTELFSTSTSGTKIGTIVKGTSTELVITGDYTFIGVRSDSGAMYLSTFNVQFEGGQDTPENVANYIMYSDQENQCTSKLDNAISYFESMSKADRNTFMTSSDYVLSTAAERFRAWLAHEGKTISYVDGDYVVSNSRNISIFSNNMTKNSETMLVVILISISTISLLTFMVIKKRKLD